MTPPILQSPPAAPAFAPRLEPPQPRTHEEYRWTRAKAVAFLEALAQCGKVAEAARGVGMSRQSAYRLKAREPEIAEPWRLALAAGKARRLARGRRRRVGRSVGRPGQGDGSRAQGDGFARARPRFRPQGDAYRAQDDGLGAQADGSRHFNPRTV